MRDKLLLEVKARARKGVSMGFHIRSHSQLNAAIQMLEEAAEDYRLLRNQLDTMEDDMSKLEGSLAK
jgi:hypothetical protein